jgi:hypothetical protein
MWMTLQQWRENGWLVPHQTTKKQITDLLKMVDRDLRVAKSTDDADWSFGIAYNAALKLCTALLYASGFRAARDLNHYRTLMALPLILGPHRDPDTSYLDQCRMKRNKLEYEQTGAASESEAQELIAFAEELRKEATAWLAKEQPDLE